MKRPNAAPVHDALAVASLVDPAVITTRSCTSTSRRRAS